MKSKPKEFVKIHDSLIFSSGWDIVMPGIKEERYELKPLMGGQFNIFYYELMAEILNENKERVGYCFVELLPGARNNPSAYQQIKNLMKKEN
jgi:hypothetical protein